MRMKRTFAACVAVTLMLGSFCVASAKNVTAYIGYSNITTKQMAVEYSNNSASKQTLVFNTRPTSGQAGAVVEVTKTNGKLVAEQTFPYYAAISDWEVKVPASMIYKAYIKAAREDCPVSGNLKYIYPEG